MSESKNYGSFYGKKEPMQETVEANYSTEEDFSIKEEPYEALLAEESKKEELLVPAKTNKAVVTGAKKVNMRYKANKSSQVINIIPEKAKVDIIDTTNTDWWKVTYKGITGYMMSKFLKEV